MAAFRDVFAPDAMASVVAYVLSISTGGRWATVVPVDTAPQKAAAPFPANVAIGREQGHPAAGFAAFYDAGKLASCRTCHSYKENGGPLGPDFVNLDKTPSAVLAALSKPAAPSPAIMVTLRDGKKFTGIQRSDSGDELRLLDVSSLPPVTRTFQKADIAAVEPVTGAGFDHAALPYSKQNLLDVAAFLGRK